MNSIYSYYPFIAFSWVLLVRSSSMVVDAADADTLPASSSLRKTKDGRGLTLKVDLNDDTRRKLQRLGGRRSSADSSDSDSSDDTTSSLAEPRQDDDAGLLNGLIELFLPVFNTAFQAVVPDPFTLGRLFEYSLFETDLLGGTCSADVGLELNLGNVIGLSNLAIDRLVVRSGTEDVNAGCLETLWSAVFDMTVSSTSLFSVEDANAGLFADACGLSLSEGVSGGINTYEPFLRGAVSISGFLLPDLAEITFANMFDEVLAIGYKNVTGWLDDVPVAWNAVIADATTQLGESMKTTLQEDIEPDLRPRATSSMEGKQVPIDTTTAIRLNARFVQNDLRRRAARTYQNTVQFFTNTGNTVLGFFSSGGGFGRGEEDGGNV